jgi:Cu2+-exporting ATPase
LGLATITFLVWSPTDFDLALLSATSVLIITCPCAFGLATPMSIAVASGTAAKRNILIKNGDALELLSKVKHIVFDKTGTLTLGLPQVDKVISQMDHNTLIGIMSAIEKHSEHPLAKAVVHYAIEHNIEQLADNFEMSPGLGVSAKVDGKRYWVGNLNYLKAPEKIEWSEQANVLEQQGYTCVWCADEYTVLGFVALNDQIKIDAKTTIEKLKSMGKTVSMLSGDRTQVAQSVANQLGIDHVAAEILPNDKAQHIKSLQRQGLVLMVGDGINDAPALTQADVSIAIGSGADVSVASADVVVLKAALAPIVEAIQLSKRTQTTIKQNIAFALLYNAFMVPLAMMAKVTPLFAAIVMPISSIIVVANAARLRKNQE